MLEWQVIIAKVARSLQVSYSSDYEIILDHLAFHKNCARCAPRELTVEHKCKRRLDMGPLLRESIQNTVYGVGLY